MNENEYNEVAVAWWGCCQECLAVVVIYPHAESSRASAETITEGPDEWEAFTSCYVCGGSIDWNGSDPVSSVIR